MPQLAIPVAAEAAVATTMTAAEVAAAEAAAALAAEQAAAALTAEQAAAAVQAAEAAQAAQVAQAAQTGQAAQTLSAAQAGGYGGVNSIGAGAGTGVGVGAGVGTGSASGIELLAKEVTASFSPSQLSSLQPEGIQQIVNAANYPLPSAVPTVPSVPNIVPPGTEFIPQSAFGPTYAPPAAPPALPPTPTISAAIFPLPSAAPAAPPVNPNVVSSGAPYNPQTIFNSAPPAAPPAAPAAPVIEAPTAAQPPVDTRFPTQTAPETLPNGGTQMRDVPTPYEWTPQTTAPNAAPGSSGLEGLLNKGIEYAKNNPLSTGLGAMSAYNALNKPKPYEPKKYKSTWNASAYSGYDPVQPTPYRPNYAVGGLADLGGYSDGGRMLKGPGDGMSDDIPATIANKQPARLANEEFVIPADVVSHLGNGSSEAGAKVLYKMMDRVRQARTGSKKQGKQIKPEKYLA